ncbi:integrase/recombinase XerD [Alkalithermobacter thermoalcaliphilus JW-YL-7 = DSM 7308]|uniref:Integrase family protein n=1 Tax=Alkalithermobacter thermoalcaliphilus JW-YL-7 = DSM 7308 TaxID=1121328 RepID=A0A150FPA3_CLOPD|nr:integrase family protein [[Clostridium] paradoxum JW-YL-7 = DSM 7308]SHK50852.1 integrase/recombinase XerD [[Clostridium] paradoxum JW-YL-7 = DSM 7308]
MINVTIKQAESNFKMYLYREGKANSTAEAYLRDLEFFRNFLKDNLNNKIRYINQITLVEIRQYKDYMLSLVESGETKRTTVSRRFNSLKTFYNFLEEEFNIKNIIKGDKFGNRKQSIDCRNALPEVLSRREIKVILDTIRNSNNKNKYRDYALFQILVNLGCRRSEVLELKWEDVDFYKNTIRITREKTSNADILPLPSPVKEALEGYMDTLPQMGEYIFQTRESGKMSVSAFTSTVNKWIKESKMEEIKGFKITAHTFRHSFITELINKNIEESKIIRYTGHKDIRTLKIYTHLNHSNLSDVNSIIEDLFQEAM